MNSIPVVFSDTSPQFSDLDKQGTLIPLAWAGEKVPAAVRYLFWVDGQHFHFLARDDNGPGLSHPNGEPGEYQAELWKYDVAEFFLQSADRSRYLEFNLSPNGAWWSSAFGSPRAPAAGEPQAIPDVVTSAQKSHSSWQAHASIPLAWLKEQYGFGEKCTLNATFILKSPAQIFLTASDLGRGEPDYHRPERFSNMRVISLA